MKKPELIVFDVNETLLDLSVMKSEINTAAGDQNAFDQWFSQLLQFAMAESLSGNYIDFGEVGKHTLEMTFTRLGKQISETEIINLLSMITSLDPHKEVPAALEKLKEAGYRMVTLTNGGLQTHTRQMAHSGLEQYFDALYSVEAVRKFKPHPETYNYVLEKEKCKASETMLIAAHAWDLLGAQRAGYKTGFIKRQGKVWYPGGIHPDMRGESLEILAYQLTT
ncbi:haloacid dehalogenase type II [Zeaxanthinibacter sp. PT1]|uniref:haloacid dehalogenase type II n=1 Tax=Zeaxanthinibacter TaxID=561554 RepID=UPI00234A5DFB|nr:haloacid dehalogenase type II [Zeaxanthinibacter sp. PT1]MDC6350361.1 haloacid dehalogenase type II [Zeaxanthinibacter sp. PT1]